MARSITRDTLFRPSRSKAESKADTTDSAAKAVIKAEADKREIKTARLKRARLENEARVSAEDAAAQPAKKRRTRRP